MDGRFLNAFTLLPRQRVICGYVTKPLCLRHRLFLTSIKSPFVDGRPVDSPKDVIVAARLLSTYSVEDMTNPKPSENDANQYIKMSDDSGYFLDQVQQVYDYIRDQSHWPVFWKKSSAGGEKGVPWVLATICGLVKGGISLEEAWTMPESQAIWMSSAMAISNGSDIDIVSDKDAEAQRRLDELYARLEQEAAANV